MSVDPPHVPLGSKFYCERSAQLASLADIDSECDITDREESGELLIKRSGSFLNRVQYYLVISSQTRIVNDECRGIKELPK